DVFHLEAAVGDRFLDCGQRMHRERRLGRARYLGKPDATQRHLAPVVPHRRLPHLTCVRRNCGRVMSSFSFSYTTSTRRPTFAPVYSASNRLPAISAPGASSSSTMIEA